MSILKSINENDIWNILDGSAGASIETDIKRILRDIYNCCRRMHIAVFEKSGCAKDDLQPDDRLLLSSIFLPRCRREAGEIFKACERQAKHRLKQAYAKIQYAGSLLGEEEKLLADGVSWLSNLFKLLNFSESIYVLPHGVIGEVVADIDFRHWEIDTIPVSEIRKEFTDFVDFRRIIQRGQNSPLYRISKNQLLIENINLFVEISPQFLQEIGDIRFTIRDGTFIAIPEGEAKKLTGTNIFRSLEAPENKNKE